MAGRWYQLNRLCYRHVQQNDVCMYACIYFIAQGFSVWFQWLTSPTDASNRAETAWLGTGHVWRVIPPWSITFFGGSALRALFGAMAASLPYLIGFGSRSPRFPALLKWYEAMDGRPAYQGIKSDYVSMGLSGVWGALLTYIVTWYDFLRWFHTLSLMYIYMLVYI